MGASGSGKATQTVTYTYTTLGQQLEVSDSVSGNTTYAYDAFGNMVQAETPQGTINYVFDPATQNHTETWTEASGTSTVKSTNVITDTVYGYDSQGRLKSVTATKLKGSTVSLETQYTYDGAGNELTETLPDSEVTTYTYDDLNRLTELTEVKGGTTLFSQIYTLNDDGTRATSLESQQQLDGSKVATYTTWGYDSLDRLTSESVISTTPSNDYSDSYTYDLDNNRLSDVHTSFPVGSWPTSLNVSLSGSDSGDVTLTWSSTGSEIGYEGNVGSTGVWLVPVSSAVYQNNSPSAYGLNPGSFQAGQWVLLADDQNSSNPWHGDEIEQGYNIEDGELVAVGGSIAIDFNVWPDAAVSGSSASITTSTTLPNPSTQTTTYAYNGDDELTGQTSTSSSATVTTTNTYDYNGSLTSSSSTTGGSGTLTLTYTYDVRNKLVGYTDGTTTASYVYDDSGDRVKETVGSTPTYYLTDTQNPTGYDQPVEQRSSPTSTSPSMTYILGNRVLGQISNASGATVTYLLVDGHGSTQQLTNSTGTISATYSYSAFGSASNGTTGTVFLFGGDAVYDPTSGLYLHGNGVRPTNGFLFIQRDEYGGDRNDPLSLHKYLYANANPVIGRDPSGHNDDNELANEAFGEADEDIAEDAAGYDAVDSYVNGSFGDINAYTAMGFAGNDLLAAGTSLDVQAALITAGITAAGAIGGILLEGGISAFLAADEGTEGIGAVEETEEFAEEVSEEAADCGTSESVSSPAQMSYWGME